MRRLIPAALVLISLLPDHSNAAGIPLVTGKCGCAIGGGLFLAKCARKEGVCTRAECARACQAAMPKRSG